MTPNRSTLESTAATERSLYGRRPYTRRVFGPGFLLAASFVAAVSVAALGGYLAGRNELLTPRSGQAGPQPPWGIYTMQGVGAGAPLGTSTGPGMATPSAAAVTSSGTTLASSAPALASSGAAVTASAATIFSCPRGGSSQFWACLSLARATGAGLSIAFTADFTLSVGQDADSHHVHLFLANPGTNGGTDPPDSIMQHVAHPGSWFNIYANGATTIDARTERGGQKLWIDTHRYSLLCVRVVTGLHSLTVDNSGGYSTGNCVRLT